MIGDKRGAHLAVSLERLEALAEQPVQRIGLSATQKPIARVAEFLGGMAPSEASTAQSSKESNESKENALRQARPVTTIDTGHLRELDLCLELPDSALSDVCSHETWDEIYERIKTLVHEHRTTLIFVNTRKLAERLAARLTVKLGEGQVTCHHGSLSKEHRLDAERRLQAGELRALVATASLELGIDIGDIELVIQIGVTTHISTLLQRVGRAGHSVGLVPKGRLFPLTREELVTAAALLRAVHARDLDVIDYPRDCIDVLAQQIVAACVEETWQEDALFERIRCAQPYAELTREAFERTLELHSQGRLALLHRDGVHGRVRATKRARMAAITSGGTIPDNTNYRVYELPTETFVGTVEADFAIESSTGDIFQLGNMSWRVEGLRRDRLLVSNAHGAPPSLPFWFGEAPARSAELSRHFSQVREHGQDRAWLQRECSIDAEAAEQIAEYVGEAKRVLGRIPTQRLAVIERFFDEAGGMQLVLHAPLGGRTMRAWGLALRKRFCKGFGFELQAATIEDSILLSLGPVHSFPLDEVFEYLRPERVRDILVQALLDRPMFEVRWRWNATRALLLPRMMGGQRVVPAIQQMRADDLLAACFPSLAACPETLPPGDLEVPDHVLVQQTIDDCLHEAMDLDDLVRTLEGIRDGRIETHTIDTPEPSVFANAVLNAKPYAFLDDAPLEERRAQAVLTRRVVQPPEIDPDGELDQAAVARVREESWPEVESAEDLHEALLWIGYITREELGDWAAFAEELLAEQRVQWIREADGEERLFAVETERDPLALWRARMEALGPVISEDPLLRSLEGEGLVLRCRYRGQQAWCHRRLLARIHRYTLEALRREIEPVSPEVFARFVRSWQHLGEEALLEGPAGTMDAIRKLAGFACPAQDWEKSILPARVRRFRPEWLDQLALEGQLVWGRLWGSGSGAVRTAPLCLLPRDDLDAWLAWTAPVQRDSLQRESAIVLELLEQRGASFAQDLQKGSGLLPSQLELGLAGLITSGLGTCDSYAGLRQLIVPPSKRKHALRASGRWSLLREVDSGSASEDGTPRTRGEAASLEFVARQLLERYGVVFRRVLERERIPAPWRELRRILHILELRGEVRGGRFVSSYSGEQFALPGAVTPLRRARKQAEGNAGAATRASSTELVPSDPSILDMDSFRVTRLVPDAAEHPEKR
jgi:ATP-dependent Lhr-like helicase